MAIEDYYTDLTLQKVTSTVDAKGGSIYETSDIAFRGNITYASSRDQYVADKKGIFVTHTLYCPVDVDIQKQDRVIDQDGGVFEVKGSPQNTVQRNHHFKLMMEKLDV